MSYYSYISNTGGDDTDPADGDIVANVALTVQANMLN